jgi:hypothetical protein
MRTAVKGMSETEGVASMLIRDVPEELRRRIRAAAGYKGQNLSDAGIEAFELWVEQVEAEMDADRRKREGKRG